MDVFSRKKRSLVMSRIRSTGSRPEEALYQIAIRHAKPRWVERNVSALPGRPDIVIAKLRVAIFADGCFYHCCPTHGHTPKSNRAYWTEKLARNVRRDGRRRAELRRLGYSVWRVWEHDLEGRRLALTAGRLGKRLQLRLGNGAARIS